MTEEEIKLDARLTAIEYVLAKLFSAVSQKVADSDFDAMCQRYVDGAERETIPGIDAAMSDLLTAEFRDALSQLLTVVKDIRQSGR